MEIQIGLKPLSTNPQTNLEQILRFDRTSNATALILGTLLKENIDNSYWAGLGYESFSDFIAQSGFSFTRRTAYNYIDLYEMFIKWKINYEEFISVPYSKMLKIKDVIDKDNLKEWLAKAKVLSRTDLMLEIGEVGHTGKGFKPMPKVYLCRDCNLWVVSCDEGDLCTCGKGLTGSVKRSKIQYGKKN